MTKYTGEEVVTLYRNGAMWSEITKRTGYCNGTIYRMLSEAGVIQRRSASGGKGIGRPSAKLTDEKVRHLRTLRAGGMTYKALGKRFEVSSVSAWKACNGSWTHVTPQIET